MPSFAKPSRIRSQCCECGLFVDMLRGFYTNWFLCRKCGTQHALVAPKKKGDGYSLFAFADGPRILPISPEMLAAHGRDEAQRMKEDAERLLFLALPLEEKRAIRREEVAESQRRQRAKRWELVWIIPSSVLVVPLFLVIGPVYFVYDLITGRERKQREAMERRLDEFLTGYRFVATVYAEQETRTTGPPGRLTRESIENLVCGHCEATKSLVYPQLRYGQPCPNCGGNHCFAVVEETGSDIRHG